MIGNRVKRRRIELGMSQQELANKVGYSSRSSINKVELDLVDVPQSKLVALAKSLDCSIEYLLGIKQKPTDKVSELRNEVGKIMSGLSEEQLEKFLELARMYRDAESTRAENTKNSLDPQRNQ